MFLIRVTLSLFITFAFVACGGSSEEESNPNSFTGSTNPAVVSNDNKQSLSTASAEGVKRSIITIESSDIPSAFKADGFNLGSHHNNLTLSAKQKATNFLQGYQFKAAALLECSDGGSISIDTPGIDETTTTIPQNGTADYTFNNCNEDGYIIDGTIKLVWSGWDDDSGFTDYTVTLDATVTFNGQTEAVTGVATCDSSGCVYSDDFSIGDTSYRIEDVEVSGDETSGYTVSVRIYDGDVGYIDLEATDIVLCSNGNISSGTIVVTDGSNTQTLTITFPDCNDCIVVFDGESTTYQQ